MVCGHTLMFNLKRKKKTFSVKHVKREREREKKKFSVLLRIITSCNYCFGQIFSCYS